MTSNRRQSQAALAAVLAFLVYGVSLSLAPAQAAVVGYVPGRLLVKFRSGASAAAIASVHDSARGRALGRLPRLDVDVVEVSSRTALPQAMALYLKNQDVEFVEPDGIAEPDASPNDPTYLSEWHLPKIGAPAAWDATTGDSGIIIAILDTGVDPTHPDLAAKLVPGWNTYDGTSDTHDVHGHGTSVAGAAAAISNNGQGVASVAWGCRLMPIRVSDVNGYAFYSTTANGLIWAADHGARVANLSYEFSGSSTVRDAANYFQSKGGVVTMSAGNSNIALTLADNPYVLTVGATDSADARATFSNTGNVLDLVAPGVNISTTANGGTYRTSSGTSYSAPIVAGVCALALSVNPKLTPTQVQDLLEQSADDLGTAGWDVQFGAGRVNAARAVQLALASRPDALPPTVVFTSPAKGATVLGVVAVALSASDGGGVASVSVSLDGGTPITLTAAPYTLSWDTAAVGNGLHSLAATATDFSGNTATAQLTVTVSNPVQTLGDKTPPTVQITSPVTGARLLSNVWVAARASDNVGVVRVDLYMDRTLVGTSKSASATYWISTVKWAKGTRVLEAVAYDAAGNYTWSPPLAVTK